MDQAILPLQWWHWLVLGMGFITLEVFVPGGFLIGLGIAALAVGATVYLAPFLGWEYQALWFAALSLISVFLMRRFFAKPIESEQPLLNRRGQQYVGRRFTLEEPIVNNHGKIKVDDSTWKVRGPDCAAGTTIVITGVDGVMLEAQHADE